MIVSGITRAGSILLNHINNKGGGFEKGIV